MSLKGIMRALRKPHIGKQPDSGRVGNQVGEVTPVSRSTTDAPGLKRKTVVITPNYRDSESEPDTPDQAKKSSHHRRGAAEKLSATVYCRSHSNVANHLGLSNGNL